MDIGFQAILLLHLMFCGVRRSVNNLSLKDMPPPKLPKCNMQIGLRYHRTSSKSLPLIVPQLHTSL